MSNPHHAEAKRTRAAKLDKMTGTRGEYPPDRAARIAKQGAGQPAQGDAAKPPEERFVGAPPRQVSNRGKIKGG
jgi:hypothetical protein